MSFQALNWAVRQRVGTPVGKGILMALANYADEKGTCFPSHERIARETELSDKSVRTHMKRFEELGIVVAKRDRDDGQRHVVIRYTLAMDQSFDLAPEDNRGARKAKLSDGVEGNEATTSSTPPEPGAAGPPEPGTGGKPPVNEGEKPPVNGGTVTLSKITNSLSPTPRRSEPSAEREPDQDRGSDRPSRLWDSVSFVDPDSDPIFDALAMLWPMKDKLAEASAVWQGMSPPERSAAAIHAPIFLQDLKAKKRTVFEALASYLRGRAWRFARPEAREELVEIKPYSRKFWVWIWRRLGEGHRVGFALSEAHRGNALWLRLNDVPTDEQEHSLVAVPVAGEAYVAWSAYLSARGASLQRPDQVPVIWCPSEYPALTVKEERESAK